MVLEIIWLRQVTVSMKNQPLGSIQFINAVIPKIFIYYKNIRIQISGNIIVSLIMVCY